MAISNQEGIPDTKNMAISIKIESQKHTNKTQRPSCYDRLDFMVIDRARIEQLNPWRLF